jgi:hypothetical protein
MGIRMGMGIRIRIRIIRRRYSLDQVPTSSHLVKSKTVKNALSYGASLIVRNRRRYGGPGTVRHLPLLDRGEINFD